ncbi:MAG: carboxylesterase/lipase family protein [Hungatella sp.]|nr:carboxylesterase/lipase family protein [Hungatella sp.]
MMKKTWLLLLSTALVAVSACSGQNPPAETTSAAAQSTVSETTAGSPSQPEESESVSDTAPAEENAALKQTQFGPVNGIEKDGALVWYGIPYGKEPSGDLRWSAPQNPDPWTEAYDASQPAETAMQLGGDGIIGTEDCLNLDVYSTEGAENLPVMVFLHGGNNQTGNPREIPGEEMVVKNDMVFVSVNYRLGLLGFNCLPALQTAEDSTGNYALLDIAQALDWVKDNIGQFGGDPDNITISGFSAGGRDVMAMLISPLFEGKFQKAIAFSGGMTIADENLSAAKIAEAIAPLAVEDKKAEDEEAAAKWLLGTEDEVREYLYGLSPERLCALMGNAGIRMSVFPHLYGDDAVLPADGFDTKHYNQVPVLMLTGTTEFSMFAYGDPYYSGQDTAALSQEELEQAKNFAISYGSQMYGYFNAEASAQRMAPHYTAPIYLCSINYGAPDSAYPIPVYGAFHGIFVPMLSTENNYAAMIPDTFDQPAYMSMADAFNQYLKNFLYTGDPNGDNLTTWEAWTPESHLSMVFDGADEQAVIECKSVATTYEDIMDNMDADTTLDPKIKEGVISQVMNGRWFSDALDQRYKTKNLWQQP